MSASGGESPLSNNERTPIISEGSDVAKNAIRKCADAIPARYTFALLGFLGMANVYMMRVNLSVAMVAMVNSSAIASANISDECPGEGSNLTSNSSKNGEFAWDEQTQGLILAAFFWGYIFTQLPGGRLAEKYSGKWLFGLGILCTAGLTLLTPLAARLGVGCLITLRILEGLSEGVTFPVMNAMLSKWCPPLERSKISTIVFAGSQMGTVIALPLSGILCEHGFSGGWPSVFYVFGALGVVWFFAWSIFAYDSPASHPYINIREKVYIMQSLSRDTEDFNAKPPVPWRKVLTSLPVWAVVVVQFGHNFGFFTLLTEMPTYLKNILHYDIQKNSFLSALPYLGMWASGMLCSFAADSLRAHDKLKTTSVRKIFQTIGSMGPAICMVVITFMGCNRAWSMVFLTLAVTLNGAIYAGFSVNQLDFAPRFAGTLLGISNAIGTIPGMIGPFIVGTLTEGQQTKEQWATVFYLFAAIYSLSCVFYILFATGEEQSWSTMSPVTEDKQLYTPVNEMSGERQN